MKIFIIDFTFHNANLAACREKFTRRMLDDFYDILTRSKTPSHLLTSRAY